MTIAPDLAPLARDITTLSLLEGNPRKGDVASVARSLEKFGQRKPIVALRDGTVIAGNHTLQAARSLGWDQIAVVLVDDDDVTAKAFALADNRTAELGTYDDEALAAMLLEVQEHDELFAASGWDAASVDELLSSMEPEVLPPVPAVDPDDVPDSAPPVTKPGDVWLCGPHRVMCGDSTSVDAVDVLMAGELADMVWTDPPYGVDYVGGTADALTIKNDGAKGLDDLLAAAIGVILAVAPAGCPVYCAAPSGPRALSFAIALQGAGIFRQRLVWVKDVLVLGWGDYHYRHEDIYFGYTPGYAGRVGRGGTGWFGDDSQTSVLEFRKPGANKEHPTMKPVELVQRCISNSSAANSLVLDLFGGSGTTMIAAHMTGRRARLMELDPTYVDVICRRWQRITGEKPTLESDGVAYDFEV